jgi:penicillin-binding protein 2
VRPYLNEARGAQLTPLHLKPSTVELVVAGMRMCMEDRNRGTGRRGHIPGMVMVGKTGTAQMVGLHHHGQYASEFDIPYELRDHAWFVCGVLDREPKISVCVLIEHGAHGSTAAAPVAREVIRYFYDRSAPRPSADTLLAQAAEEE